MTNTNDMRSAFQDFRDQRNKELAANGLDDQSNFWITNAHYTAWCRGIEWLSQQAQVPDGYALLPKELTAENGAKALLLGEFYSEIVQECPDCDSQSYEGGDGECELCSGEGVSTLRVPVSWSTIKNIWRMAADKLTAYPAPDHAADVRKMVAPDVSELEKAAQKLWRESYSCESDFIQAVVDALSKQEETER